MKEKRKVIQEWMLIQYVNYHTYLRKSSRKVPLLVAVTVIGIAPKDNSRIKFVRTNNTLDKLVLMSVHRQWPITDCLR